MRYTAPITQRVFAGIHIGWQKDYMKVSQRLQIPQQAGELVNMRGQVNVDWSMDFLGRIGMNAGPVAPYLAVGPSIARGEIKASAPGFSISDNATHLGFKIAIGMGFPVMGNVTSFIQGEYADYADKTYFGNSNIKGGADTLGGRIGLLYNF